MAHFLYLLLAVVFTLLAYLMEGGIPALLFQPAELIMICIPSLFFGIAATSGRVFCLSWKLVFGNPAQVDTQEVKQVCRYLKVFGYTSFIMGGVGTVLGFVITLQALAELPEVLGHHVGAALISLLYGAFFKMFCYVAEQRVRGKYLEAEL